MSLKILGKSVRKERPLFPSVGVADGVVHFTQTEVAICLLI